MRVGLAVIGWAMRVGHASGPSGYRVGRTASVVIAGCGLGGLGAVEGCLDRHDVGSIFNGHGLKKMS